LPRPVIMQNCSMPAARASSIAYWIKGLSTTGSISLAVALVAGRNLVPRPATGRTALRNGLITMNSLVSRKQQSMAGGNVALTSGAGATRRARRITLPRTPSRVAAPGTEQDVARLVDPRGEPVRPAAVRVGG